MPPRGTAFGLAAILGMIAVTQMAAQGRGEIVNEPVVAVPKSQVYGLYGLPWDVAQGAEPHIASGTGRGYHQVVFRTEHPESTGAAPARGYVRPPFQWAIAVDYTPASARVYGELQYRRTVASSPSGKRDFIWSEPRVKGSAAGGRLFWCYSLTDQWAPNSWRLLFTPFGLEDDDDFSYRFSAEHTDSITCELDPQNDGGIPGTGTGGDFGPFDIYVDGTQGQLVQITIGIRDHACEDGDVVSVYLGDGYGDRAVFTNTEIFNHWQEKPVAVRAGYHYQVRAVAVNGTGFKGACNHRDANSGELRVKSARSSITDEWAAPGGSERAGIINVLAVQ